MKPIHISDIFFSFLNGSNFTRGQLERLKQTEVSKAECGTFFQLFLDYFRSFRENSCTTLFFSNKSVVRQRSTSYCMKLHEVYSYCINVFKKSLLPDNKLLIPINCPLHKTRSEKNICHNFSFFQKGSDTHTHRSMDSPRSQSLQHTSTILGFFQWVFMWMVNSSIPQYERFTSTAGSIVSLRADGAFRWNMETWQWSWRVNQQVNQHVLQHVLFNKSACMISGTNNRRNSKRL